MIEPAMLTRPQVKRLLGVDTNAALARYVRLGTFPKPFRWMTARKPVWRKSDVERWLGQKIKEEPSDAAVA